MFVKNKIILAANPFFDAYIHSDILGKIIIVSLIFLSIITWIILLHKVWLTKKAKGHSLAFYHLFSSQKIGPLTIEYDSLQNRKKINPFLSLYLILKKHTIDILNKNKRFSQSFASSNDGSASYLSPADIGFIEAQLLSGISSQIKDLEKNLFILSTIVSLAPFLGLLGTVWGILTTFSQPQMLGGSHQIVLGGLSMALATTVLGLLDAIPALIGYNYLKNQIRDLATEMESFCNEVLSSVEMKYRKVDLA